MKVPLSFYRNDDVTGIAKQLLGQYLITRIDGKLTGGIITETEAYAGITDKASHAYNNRRTRRTKVMFDEGGRSYVYFTYGMHHLFNIVTSVKDNPHAVLIRAIHPTLGINIMLKRRGKQQQDKNLTNGPAKLCQALGISLQQNNILLDGEVVWVEYSGWEIDENIIAAGPRVGVDYAQEDALLFYRFLLEKLPTAFAKNSCQL